MQLSIHLSELGRLDEFNPEDRTALYKLLNNYPKVLILSAHTHFQINSFMGEGRSTPIHDYNVGATCGDWYSGILNEKGIPVSTMRDGSPKGYALLNISGNEYTIDYKVVDKPKDYQISIYNPKVVRGCSPGAPTFQPGHKHTPVACTHPRRPPGRNTQN